MELRLPVARRLVPDAPTSSKTNEHLLSRTSLTRATSLKCLLHLRKRGVVTSRNSPKTGGDSSPSRSREAQKPCRTLSGAIGMNRLESLRKNRYATRS